MSASGFKIGVVAPGTRIEPSVAERVEAIASALYPDATPDITFHPQCYLSSGHFAGDDEARARAFLDVANDESFDALWFARGGYGACRLVERLLPQLTDAARNKTYLGYSDAGSILAGLYGKGFDRLAHGPMPVDALREGGEEAIKRALRYLEEGAADTLEPTVSPETKTAAFNLMILSQLVGTPFLPSLEGHVLMLEEVGEYMYRIDRDFFHITSNPDIRRVAGIKLGRCSDITPNDTDFGQTAEEVARHWCEIANIPYLGRADIGHDVDNKIVPFGASKP